MLQATPPPLRPPSAPSSSRPCSLVAGCSGDDPPVTSLHTPNHRRSTRHLITAACESRMHSSRVEIASCLCRMLSSIKAMSSSFAWGSRSGESSEDSPTRRKFLTEGLVHLMLPKASEEPMYFARCLVQRRFQNLKFSRPNASSHESGDRAHNAT